MATTLETMLVCVSCSVLVTTTSQKEVVWALAEASMPAAAKAVVENFMMRRSWVL